MNDSLAQFNLAGKKALVTGGSRGLGRAFVDALFGAGAEVIIVRRQDATDNVPEPIANFERSIPALRADLSNPAERTGLVQRAADHLGGLDILVNNAGITHRQAAIDFPLEEWSKVLEVNLSAVFDLSQQAARLMWDRGGRIINIASMTSYVAGWTIPAYAASKSGIAGLTRALANEWAVRGITVNAIAPGYFKTDINKSLREDSKRNPEILAHIPMNRWGDPEELSGAMILLASDAGRYITGQLINVDGGYLVR